MMCTLHGTIFLGKFYADGGGALPPPLLLILLFQILTDIQIGIDSTLKSTRRKIYFGLILSICNNLIDSNLQISDPFGLGRFATDHSHKDRFATFVRSCSALRDSNKKPLPLAINKL